MLGRGGAEVKESEPMPTPLASALAAYNDLLSLWKDADPNILILKEAKSEYAKLQ
jgi:hypothetical protein